MTKNFTKLAYDNMKKMKLDVESESKATGLLGRTSGKPKDKETLEPPAVRVASYVQIMKQKREEMKDAKS